MKHTAVITLCMRQEVRSWWLRSWACLDRRTRRADALRSTDALTDGLREIGLPRSSYFYHRARLEAADKYGDVRRAMTGIFERNWR